MSSVTSEHAKVVIFERLYYQEKSKCYLSGRGYHWVCLVPSCHAIICSFTAFSFSKPSVTLFAPRFDNGSYIWACDKRSTWNPLSVCDEIKFIQHHVFVFLCFTLFRVYFKEINKLTWAWLMRRFSLEKFLNVKIATFFGQSWERDLHRLTWSRWVTLMNDCLQNVCKQTKRRRAKANTLIIKN